MRWLYYKLYIRYLAIIWMFRINLGNKVWYKNELYCVSNGVCSGSWALNRIRDGAREEYAPRNKCKLQLKPSNVFHSYASAIRFYEGYCSQPNLKNED